MTPKDLNLMGAANGVLLNLAVRERMILLSEDHGFGDVIKFPPHTHCGVILLKVPFQDDENMSILTDHCPVIVNTSAAIRSLAV